MKRVVYQGFFCLILFLRAELVKATEHYPVGTRESGNWGRLNRMLACCPGWPLSLTRAGVLSWPATAMPSWPPKATSATSCLSWHFKGLSRAVSWASFLQPYPPPTPLGRTGCLPLWCHLARLSITAAPGLLLLFLSVFLFSLIFIWSV